MGGREIAEVFTVVMITIICTLFYQLIGNIILQYYIDSGRVNGRSVLDTYLWSYMYPLFIAVLLLPERKRR